MIKFLKWSWRLTFVAVLTLSLALNVAGFVGSALWTSASAVWEAATGLRSFVTIQAAAVRDLTDERHRLHAANTASDRRNKTLQSNLDEALDAVANERRVAQSMADDVVSLRSRNATLQANLDEALEVVTNERRVAQSMADDVVSLRSRNATLQSNLDEALDAVANERRVAQSMADDVVSLRSRNATLQSNLDEALEVVANERRIAQSIAGDAAAQVSETTATMTRRLNFSAARNVGSMPAEAVPYIGAGVIVGITVLELYDLCETLKDLEALNLAFNPNDAPSEDRRTVCAMVVPTADEIMESVANSPAAAWDTAKSFVTGLPEVDFETAWESTIDGTIDFGGRVRTGADNATDAAMDALSSGWENTLDAATGIFGE
jgi:hypothetical protein